MLNNVSGMVSLYVSLKQCCTSKKGWLYFFNEIDHCNGIVRSTYLGNQAWFALKLHHNLNSPNLEGFKCLVH